MWTRDFTAVSVEGVGKAGGQAEDWLVWIIPAGCGAQGPSLVVWYLPWVMRAGRQWSRVWEPHGGRGGVRALGWLVCIGKACSQVSCLLSLGPGCPGRGSPSWVSQAPDVRA